MLKILLDIDRNPFEIMKKDSHFLGVAIVAILEDTVKRDNNKELIYWNEENICRDFNRDQRDNIADVFLPLLMQIKESMLALKIESGIDINTPWIKVRTL